MNESSFHPHHHTPLGWKLSCRIRNIKRNIYDMYTHSHKHSHKHTITNKRNTFTQCQLVYYTMSVRCCLPACLPINKRASAKAHKIWELLIKAATARFTPQHKHSLWHLNFSHTSSKFLLLHAAPPHSRWRAYAHTIENIYTIVCTSNRYILLWIKSPPS